MAPLTKIASGAFQNVGSLKTVVLPSSVIEISDHAFHDAGIETINTGNVIRIGNSGLRGTKLTTLDLTSVTTLIDNSLSRFSTLTYVYLPSLTSVREYSFYKSGIQTLILGSGITTLEKDVFNRADGLTKLEILVEDPSNIVLTVDGATGEVNTFNGIDLSGVTLYLPTQAAVDAYKAVAGWNNAGFKDIVMGTNVLAPNSTIGNTFTVDNINYVITDDVDSNEVSVTGLDTALVDVVIPVSVSSMSIDYTVTALSNNVFKSDSIIESVEILAPLTIIASSAFENTSSLKTVVLSSSVREIGNNSFQDCKVLASINTENITVIGGNSFKDCNAITHLDLSSLVTLGSNGIGRMLGLTRVELPVIETIDSYAFVYNDNLKQINIGASILTINSQGFNGLSGLEEVQVNTVTPIAMDTQEQGQSTVLANVTLLVPDNPNAGAAYEAAKGWEDFGTVLSGVLVTENVVALNINMYPNPTNGIVNVITQGVDATITVYDLSGRALLSTTTTQVDLSGLASGVYLVKVKTANGLLVKRIVKQ